MGREERKRSFLRDEVGGFDSQPAMWITPKIRKGRQKKNSLVEHGLRTSH